MKLADYKLSGKLLPIRTYPDPVLTKVAEPVKVFDAKLVTLVQDMLYTMYHAPGIGLAAPQIGLSQRLFVVDIDYEREALTDAEGREDFKLSGFNPMVFINPVFSCTEGKQIYKEGCLSVPEVYEEVERFEKIQINYVDLQGKPHQMLAEGLFAVCLQHENDHLNGVVFIDRLSALKKKFFKNKLLKDKSKI
jgi:peptide deformylase